MWEQASQDPEQRGTDVGKGREAGPREYGRAIDCGARLTEPRRAAGHGRGAREGESAETPSPRG